MGTGKQRGRFYNPDRIVDAPEFHLVAKSMGILTTSMWDHQPRAFDQRREDFISAFPPESPTRFMSTELDPYGRDAYKHAGRGSLMSRFLAKDWRPGSLHELLARYGLKMDNAPPRKERVFAPGAFLETARRRNYKLRVLHGGVDVEARDMDEAKADWLERQEKIRAAEQVRVARKRMREEHAALDAKERESPDEPPQ